MINLSKAIIKYIGETFGEEFLHKYKYFLEDKYPSHIRINGKRTENSSLIKSLSNQGIILKKIEEIENVFQIIEGESLIGKTIEHLLGNYYIQSLSSMIPALVLSPTKEDRVLDLCAAPGSKSTQIAELMEYEGTLCSNEPNQKRIKALVHNMDKSNAVNMCVIMTKGELLSKIFNEYFDKILVDAPCSALGVIQKNQEVSNWWNTNSVSKISSLQLKLLISAIKMAKVGAEIVYSTCTLTVEENEYVVNKVIQNYPVELVQFDLNFPHRPGYDQIREFKFDTTITKAKRIIPWEVNSEGFFVAKLRKIDSVPSKIPIKESSVKEKLFLSANDKLIKDLLEATGEYYGIDLKFFKDYKYLLKGKDLYIVDSNLSILNLEHYIRIGIKFGLIDKNKNLKLHTNAAQLLGLHAKKNIMELKNETEVRTYFNGGIIQSTQNLIGQKIIKYNNQILGTAVAVNNGLKSQFPRSMRTTALN